MARGSVLAIGLLLAAGTTPGIAAATPESGPPVNQGNTAPGSDTQGNNDPGTTKTGHPNGGTGADTGGGTVDPDTTPDLGTAQQFELALTRPVRAPGDLPLSGATFSFARTTGNAPPRTCTTDDDGTCTVTWFPHVTGNESVLLLSPGTYVVTQTGAVPGLVPAAGPIGSFDLCVVFCDPSLPIAVKNASLFRTQVVATVAHGDGRPVEGQQYSLAGQPYAGRAGDAYSLDAETSDAQGRLVFDGWFAPGPWTFTPTTPDGFELLEAQQRTLATADAQAALLPWEVSLVREELVTVPGGVLPTGGAGSSGSGDTGGGTTGDTGSQGNGDGGIGDSGTGISTSDAAGGGTGTGTSGTGTGGSDTGDSGTGTGDGTPVDPGSGTDTDDSGQDNSGIGDPEPVVPGTDGSGTDDSGQDNSGIGEPEPVAPDANGSGQDGSGTDGSGIGTTIGDGGYDPGAPAVADGVVAPSTAPTSASSATTFRRSTSDGASGSPARGVLADAPQLETVSLDAREAGVVGFGVLFVSLVFFGWFLYRRRARRDT